MKMRELCYNLILIVMTVSIVVLSMGAAKPIYAQYEVVLKNDKLLTGSEYDFDIFIKSKSGAFNLTSYQIMLAVNDSIANGGELTFSYIKGSSQLLNIPIVDIGLISDRGVENLAVGSNHGDDNITSDYVKLGKFRLSNTKEFASCKADIDWDFKGLLKSIINVSDSNETNELDFKDSLQIASLHIITGITQKDDPSKFELCQNYPNPFNPSTKIEYVIPVGSFVSLKIFDILGRQIAVPVDENQQKGTHTVHFDGASLPSGIYIYVLRAGEFFSQKKMILLK
jgi:hypothetical protein